MLHQWQQALLPLYLQLLEQNKFLLLNNHNILLHTKLQELGLALGLFDNPETVIGLLEDVPVILPGVEVAVYVVPIGFPKYDGAVKETVALAFPADAEPIVGVPG